MPVTGSTRVIFMIGDPIRQVRSPLLFNRRFEDLRYDAVMIPAAIAPHGLIAFMATLRAMDNADGCVVTIPHKSAVVEHLDDLSVRARRLGAVNVIRRTGDRRLIGDIVDGLGFLTAAGTHGFDPAGRAALIVGSGGAGRAIADALCERGLRHLTIHDVDAARARALADLLHAVYPLVNIALMSRTDLRDVDLVVNASPVGMDDSKVLPIPAVAIASIRPDALVADVVTDPAMTAFLQLAQAAGCRIQQGPEMSSGQTELLGQFIGCFPER